jgi:serine/threonine-protein kinase
MICASCSANVSDGAFYCSACGEQVSSASQAPTDLASPSFARAAQRRSPSSVPIGRLASRDSIDGGTFAPGTVLVDRYRIIGLLGRGGMGEVYRADDLTLGQPVALKFLPRALADDAGRRERFLAEVRLSRQVSHPNVCRVYDVGEIEGQLFLSMEFIDGEDLASLLRRIGRLPHDKALELSRELCVGLAAAHDKKVLHRDLKPANVMVDGRGRLRIADFGLAVTGEESAGRGEIAGTPAYMAPEQLDGKDATVRSDLYSLGLVLYELFTGRKGFDAATLPEMRRQKEAGPTPPSQIAPDLDPKVELVILRCLEKDPARRPGSALQVSAALPGGDPLAAALAAGETPSPEMVAAAGGSAGLSPRVALACLMAIFVSLALLVLLADRSNMTARATYELSPAELAFQAQEIASRAGYSAKPFDRARGLVLNKEYLDFVRRTDRSITRWKDLDSGRPPGLEFWYRTSPREMSPPDPFTDDRISKDAPPRNVAGMVLVVLDMKGRLLDFEAVPPQTIPKGSAPAPDWGSLIAAAGLGATDLHPAAPSWLPETFADSQSAWTGAFPDLPKTPIHVEAAAYRGIPVMFRVVWPWTRPERETNAEGSEIGNTILLALFLTILVGGVLVARRNLRLGRGDRRGAFRFALFVFAAFLLGWLLDGTHVASSDEVRLFVEIAGFDLFVAMFAYFLYLAVEPFVRRRWPGALVSWTRVLAGQFRDGVVGRDVLVGVLWGTCAPLLNRTMLLALDRFGIPVQPYVQLDALLGFRFGAARIVFESAVAACYAVAIFFLLFLLRSLLRKDWLAAIVFMGIFTLQIVAGSEQPLKEAPFFLVIAGSIVFILVRFGLVAYAAGLFTILVLFDFPITRHLAAWYAPTGILAVVVIAALAVYGYMATLEGRSAFAGLLDT